MLNDSEIEALRQQYGDVREVVFENDDGQDIQVVLRRPRADWRDPKADEFFAWWTKRSLVESTKVEDPTVDGSAILLGCVVEPGALMDLKRHLADYPGDMEQLRDMFKEVAGEEDLKDAPELVTEQVKTEFHRRAMGFRVNGMPLFVRPMSAPEYATFIQRNGGRLFPLRGEALAWAAWSCASEAPDKDKRKPAWDSLVAERPMAAIQVGFALLGAARSKVKTREKKSMTPSLPPSEKDETESSAPAAPSCSPLQAALEAPAAVPALST